MNYSDPIYNKLFCTMKAIFAIPLTTFLFHLLLLLWHCCTTLKLLHAFVAFGIIAHQDIFKRGLNVHNQGPFTNYVPQISDKFNPPPLSSLLYLQYETSCNTSAYHLSPQVALRNFWTVPKPTQKTLYRNVTIPIKNVADILYRFGLVS